MNKISTVAASAAVIGFCVAVSAHAQAYPAKPITIVIPQQAGSASDNVIRPLVPALQEALGQPIVIENRAGANGIIGSEYVAHARPDGYTLLLASSSVFVTNPNLYRKLAYDPVKDFRSLAGLSRISMLFMARPGFPVRTIDELVAQARAQPGAIDIAYGSSTAQLAIGLLSSASGMRFNTIAYKGSPQLLTDLMGGTVPLGVVDIASGAPYASSGRATALASTDSARAAFMAEVPTLAERYPGVSLVSWTGLVAPKGTPDAIATTWYQAVRTVLERPEVLERLAMAKVTPSLMSPAELDRTIALDIGKWGALMRAAGMEKE